ncbi:unnamed protein product [Notodromas monacha]|uniref:Uncharacterized protein n=1 Tax=Notodromas monacha TaxID=399045 RepID=A0A7R9GJK0_9CRUS|nr:unnamed protein product [Notodromas monacha]CAG0922899.1 unnamed protein product [Notodromas monacha]
MRAFLVKLHYGLRDLSYIELGECGSKQGSVHHHQGRTRKRRTTEFYVEWFDVDEHGLTCIPMLGNADPSKVVYIITKEERENEERPSFTWNGSMWMSMDVHKLEDGVKLGAPCSRQQSLHKVFSLGEDIRRSGAFVLEPDEKRDFRFDVTVKINREIVPSHLKRSVLLMHGDIIELFLQDILLGELSQELEFAAISGANIDEVKSVLECLFYAQTCLKELWIRVYNASKPAFEEIIEVLMRFKRLEEVLFVYTPCPPSKRSFDNDDDSDDALDSDYTMMEYPLRTFQRVMREFAHPGCCWKQATLLYDGPYIKEYFTYSFTLRMETEFSSFAVTKFFSDWFRHVMDGNGGSEFGAADLISALFPKQTE